MIDAEIIPASVNRQGFVIGHCIYSINTFLPFESTPNHPELHSAQCFYREQCSDL